MINHDYDSARYSAGDMAPQKAWTLIKIIGFYIVLFVMALVTVKLYAFIGRNIILIGSMAMILFTLISHWLVPNERPNQIMGIKRNLFMYLGTLMGAYLLIIRLTQIDPNMVGVSLGGSSGTTMNNTALMWIQAMTMFLTIMPPIAHVGYEVKRIWTYYDFSHGGKVTKRKRAEQLQKTIVR